jgi:predicted DNA-binding protein YlxM (UPF0122 family)
VIKINENKDLSKQVLEINIDSPIFNCLRQDLNEEIQRCISQVYDEKFSAGEISIKLTIELLNSYQNIPREDEYGETMQDTFLYRKPNFEHKITTTLKKRYKQEGSFTDEREVIFEDGEYKAIPLKDPQVSIEDLD